MLTEPEVVEISTVCAFDAGLGAPASDKRAPVESGDPPNRKSILFWAKTNVGHASATVTATRAFLNIDIATFLVVKFSWRLPRHIS